MTGNAEGRGWSRAPVVAAAVVAAILLAAALELPVWRMTLRAPQYPQGLEIVAYGNRVEGDLYEINIINHYVGMGEIAKVPAPEMKLFELGVWLLVALCLLAPLHRVLAWIAVAAIALMPLVVLGDLQWWLHKFGRDLDPSAPLRLEPFTPLALGLSKIGQFETTGTLSWGLVSMLLAAAVLAASLILSRRARPTAAALAVATSAAMLLIAAPPDVSAVVEAGGSAVGTARAAARSTASAPIGTIGAAATRSLQQRIDATPAGGTLVVDGGVYPGPIVVTGPMTVVGRGRPVIDGRGRGTVVTLTGEGVAFTGFEVRNGGRTVSEEPAGIKAQGSGHRIEDNHVRDVFFGIHLSNGRDNVVRGNRVEPGLGDGLRPGHGISVWYVRASRVDDNVVRRSRDGIYLSFSDDISVTGNEVTDSRYGVHSMFAQRATLDRNHIHHNLLGVALMNSSALVMRDNRIERHRAGATAYGVLLKDIDDFVLSGNRILDNRVGLYADAAPIGPGEALVTDNLFAGNGAALAVQSNVRLVFSGNRVIDNLIDVRAEGARTSQRNQWSRNGRGNHWSGYRGYDADGDGIGDLPYRYEPVLAEIARRDPAALAFLLTPAQLALEQAARMFPLVRPEPLLVDEHPLVEVDG